VSRWFPVQVEAIDDAQADALALAMPSHVRAIGAELSKGDSPKPKWRVTGLASTEHKDRQGDTIRQDGLDWTQFLKHGFINDDHGKTANDIIGYPTKVRAVKVRDGNRTIPATAIEGYLFDTPKAAQLAALAKSMHGTPRQMGFSVEGPAPKRSVTDPSEIVGAVVTHVAFTPWPVNPYATAVVELQKSVRLLCKAMTAGSGVAVPGASVPGAVAPVMPQDLQLYVVPTTFQIGDARPGRRLTKSEAIATIRRHFPGATDAMVEQLLALAKEGAQ